MSETWVRLELKTTHSVAVRDPAGRTFVLRIIRTNEPKFRELFGLWSWQAMQLWGFYLARAVRHDKRWTVEVLPDGHQDWQDDWRKAEPVEVMNTRAEAFEKAIETALKIQTGR
jgi:hypothetical protein